MEHYDVVIDVREPNEYEQGHVPQAVNVPVTTMAPGNEILSTIPKQAKIAVYCRTGARAEKAVEHLNAMGYQDVTNEVNQEKINAL